MDEMRVVIEYNGELGRILQNLCGRCGTWENV
jgi:hypothetical protein